MSEGARDWLLRGVAAAKDDSVEEARFCLERALGAGPTQRQRVDAYYWLSEIMEEDTERRELLKQILALEPTHYAARRNLALLDGRLDVDEILNPNEPVPAPPESSPAYSSRRYTCKNCGGRMAYSPDGGSLVCDYCGGHRAIPGGEPGAAHIPEEDFILALATAKGKRTPVSMPSFDCSACGGSFVVSRDSLSLSCPYCTSTYVLENTGRQDIVPPEAILPFQTSKSSAQEAFFDWVEEKEIEAVTGFLPPAGLYIPVWTFDVSGQAPFTMLRHDGHTWIRESGSRIILYDDLPIPASHALPQEFSDEVDGYHLDELVSFDPAYLVAWPAEMYEISVDEGAMQARWKALARVEADLQATLIGHIQDLRVSVTSLLIESYRLIFLPLWLMSYTAEGRRFEAVVNGQTGKVRAKTPPGRLTRFLQRLSGVG